SAQIREILISESAWEEMTCLFAPSLATRLPVRIPLPTAALRRGIRLVAVNRTPLVKIYPAG
ncbi:hypothetical protein AAGP18_27680, partial [Klebsiella pneumoniae]